MKEKWAEICKSLTMADNEFDEFIKNSALSAMDVKKIQKFIKAWNNLKKQSNDFDKYLIPPEAVETELPFNSETFDKMWLRWKEYLSEQHGILMRSRSEISALEHIRDISGGDENKAISFLRYAMACRYKSFFVVDEKATKEPAKAETTANKKSDFD